MKSFAKFSRKRYHCEKPRSRASIEFGTSRRGIRVERDVLLKDGVPTSEAVVQLSR